MISAPGPVFPKTATVLQMFNFPLSDKHYDCT